MSDAVRPAPEHASTLPAGTRLGEFEVRRVLGIGGFGIVYLAFDHALEREVAVKEYMPASMAGRTQTLHVSLRSQSDSEIFALGLRSFVNEAKLLARFDHPSLIKVHRFWEANGTAYMAMPVLRGKTLKDLRRDLNRAPDEAWLRGVLEPLLGALECLHDQGVFHRDIAPDNIQIEPDGRPVLLDFGAARRVISDKTQTLTAILKPAYAPIEQYAEAGSVKQGPWTDLYALGATLHFLLLGFPPAPATARAVSDEQATLSSREVPQCSDAFLHIVNWMLAPRPGDRPQSVTQLRDVLEGRADAPVRRTAEPAPSAWAPTQVQRPAGTAASPPPGPAADADATVLLPPAPPGAAVQPPAPDWPATRVAARIPAPSPVAPPAPGPEAGPASSDADATRIVPRASAATRDLPPSLDVAPPGGRSTPVPPKGPETADRADRTPSPPLHFAASVPPGVTVPPPAPPRSHAVPIALGVLVVVGAAAAFALWPQRGGDGGAVSSGAASAASLASPAPAASPVAVGPAAGTGAVAASAPAEGAAVMGAAASAARPGADTSSVEPAPATTTPPVAAASDAAVSGRPRPGFQATTAPLPRPPATSPRAQAGAQPSPPAPAPGAGNRPAGTTTGVAPPVARSEPAVPPAALRNEAPATARAQPASAPQGAGNTKPAAESARNPAAAAPPPVAPPAAEPALPASPAIVQGPEQRCGGRNPLSYFVCMERECLRSQFQSHPDCVAWRRNAPQRQGGN